MVTDSEHRVECGSSRPWMVLALVWHDRVFLTTAVSPGAFKAPSTGIYGNDSAAELQKQGLSDQEIVKRVVGRDIELTSETGEIKYMVLALDAKRDRHRRARTQRLSTRPEQWDAEWR